MGRPSVEGLSRRAARREYRVRDSIPMGLICLLLAIHLEGSPTQEELCLEGLPECRLLLPLSNYRTSQNL
jgi:hypothetical protein